VGFLQKFHLVIKYKKRILNKIVDMLSRPIVNASTILGNNYLAHESFFEQYVTDDEFKDVYEALNHDNQNEELDYHVHNILLCILGNLCIPKDERANVIRESHTSLISGHFRVGKTVAQLQRYFYWPQMIETIPKYVKGCVLCATSKPSNRNFGLYKPLLVPSQP
jgi:hypothetical protein